MFKVKFVFFVYKLVFGGEDEENNDRCVECLFSVVFLDFGLEILFLVSVF